MSEKSAACYLCHLVQQGAHTSAFCGLEMVWGGGLVLPVLCRNQSAPWGGLLLLGLRYSFIHFLELQHSENWPLVIGAWMRTSPTLQKPLCSTEVISGQRKDTGMTAGYLHCNGEAAKADSEWENPKPVTGTVIMYQRHWESKSAQQVTVITSSKGAYYSRVSHFKCLQW